MSASQRPVRLVPRPVLALLWLALAAQLSWRLMVTSTAQAPPPLPSPPKTEVLRLVGLHDEAATARLLTLWLQSRDTRHGQFLPPRRMNYQRLIAWLDRILTLDPRSQYPLLLASRVYAEVPEPGRQRQMLEFLYQKFQEAPAHRWRWLAHGAILARHRLQDPALALKYAGAIAAHAHPDMPEWAVEMPKFILEDMDELQQARLLIGGLLASGTLKSRKELEFLRRELEKLEKKAGAVPSRQSMSN